MDLSSTIAWLVPLGGVVLAAAFGIRSAITGRARIWGVAFGVALLLAIGLTFVQVFLHSACIEYTKSCQSRGDGNMSYWFQSFFAAPLYWLAAGSAWQLRR